ncbi:hypothetical protein O6H91_05G128600 [Diphasiastrum complanatum]|uniref:Uncharacterized protein n=1 Tax=Diphasiastrum complanatum TaxID=34168 RepID=A0ACC2DT22_DIPCM|nr:hypothetical protein O6H91_05G128600 [Diphasiastrum complanatum]
MRKACMFALEIKIMKMLEKEFSMGRTPNPDLPCNQYIKFDALLEQALHMGADWLATGHYARLSQSQEGSWQLLRGVDRNKDQSYFLASVGQAAFHKVIFPLGSLLKSEVRKIATEAGLQTANRRSSAGICFVGRRQFSEFIAEYVDMIPGPFVSVTDKAVLGTHTGLPAYTFGQRARIAGATEAWYVVGKDVKNHIVFVAQGSAHPALYCKSAVADSLFWISGQPPKNLQVNKPLNCLFKARYAQALRACSVSLLYARPDEMSVQRDFSTAIDGFKPSQFCCMQNVSDGSSSEDPTSLLKVHFQSPAKAITPGQALVLYSGDICLGGGLIHFPGPTLFEV